MMNYTAIRAFNVFILLSCILTFAPSWAEADDVGRRVELGRTLSAGVAEGLRDPATLKHRFTDLVTLAREIIESLPEDARRSPTDARLARVVEAEMLVLLEATFVHTPEILREFGRTPRPLGRYDQTFRTATYGLAASGLILALAVLNSGGAEQPGQTLLAYAGAIFSVFPIVVLKSVSRRRARERVEQRDANIIEILGCGHLLTGPEGKILDQSAAD